MRTLCAFRDKTGMACIQYRVTDDAYSVITTRFAKMEIRYCNFIYVIDIVQAMLQYKGRVKKKGVITECTI